MDSPQKPQIGRHRAKLLHLVEQSPDAVWIAQLDGTLIYVNDAAARLLDSSPDALIGSRGWLSLLHEADQPNAWPLLPTPDGHTHLELELRVVGANNRHRWIRDRRHRFHDPTDATDYIGGTWDDITAARHAQQEQIEQRRRDARTQQLKRLESLRRLAAGVGHSFSNMLTPIMSFSELALGSLPHGHPAAGDLQQVIASSRQASGLLHQLLAFSRKQNLQKRPLDLNELVRAAMPTLRGVVGNAVRLQTELCFAPAMIRADQARIQQVLVNLLSNSRNAMATGGRVLIRTEVVALLSPEPSTSITPGEYVRLTVQDSGVGIDPRIIDHIFEPFFTTQRPDQEAGLGLATVYGIITQHKAAILVDSELGKGTTVQLLFRLHDDSLHEPSTSEISVATLTATPKNGKETVLVVEDDDVVRDLIARILRRHGYEILTAEGPEQALQIVGRSQPIDLLLSDVIMPEMNGPELAAQILAIRPGLRVLYASGHTSTESMHDQDTPHHFLQKPFTAQSLIAKIQEVLAT
jgi:two-component system cell cycle sensor histidine kinase/response regulator CckA